MVRFAFALGSASIALSTVLPAQGGVDDNGSSTGFLNFESPQVRPITSAQVDTNTFLIVCNTPDNSVEVFRADDMTQSWRVAVGQEPVSVLWVGAPHNSFYTCNMLGDSVSRVSMLSDGAGGVILETLSTEMVGDEPMDLVYDAVDDRLIVSLNTSSGFTIRDAMDLSEIVQIEEMTIDIPTATGIVPHAVKEPRALLLTPNRTLLALAFRGFGTEDPDGLDMYSVDTTGTARYMAELGTTNAAMAQSGDGTVFVVSSDRDFGPTGERNVAASPTGFVRSMLHRIDNVSATSPTETRDLNSGGVTRAGAVSQPTGVAIREDAAGVPQQVVLTSFGTDRVVIIDNPLATGANWSLSYVDITPIGGYADPIAGPRAVTIVGDNAYVLNRFDNSVSEISLTGPTYSVRGTTSLTNDPTPTYIKEGRRFLYDAMLSRTGFVSCASCHIDGRLDGQAWNLGESGGGFDGQGALVAKLEDGFNSFDLTTLKTVGFPLGKGNMITQSLQGLVNWEVDPAAQHHLTNAPYHWRGDRETFLDFAGAFRSLLFGPANPSAATFVDDADMLAFERFVSSISYPPNPEQDAERVYRGNLGDVDDHTDGDGTLRGLKAFHILGFAGTHASGRSCAQCHSLPEGSNNRLTQQFDSIVQPSESAALRGLRQKERELVRFVPSPEETDYVTGSQGGVLHTGADRATMNDFITGAFTPLGLALDDTVAFVRQLDTGVAPAVGRSITMTSSSLGSVLGEYLLMRDRANVGNVGLAVHAWDSSGSMTGYWQDLADVQSGPTGALELKTVDGLTAVSWNETLARLNIDIVRLIVHCTPLGNERRVAAAGGPLPTLTGTTDPVVASLEPMVPNTAYAPVPMFRGNWDPLSQQGNARPFVWTGNVEEPKTLRYQRIMQRALIDGGFMTQTRHDPPRRLQVRGTQIRHGAVLEIEVGGAGGDLLRFPIYATNDVTPDGTLWTTAAELEPIIYYQLMLGGFEHTSVKKLLKGAFPGESAPNGTFDPQSDNQHLVRVVNSDGTSGEAPTLQVLTLQ